MARINMMPRPHHYTFTHRVLPRELFRAPARVVEELAGPMGGTFLFYLWEEIGKGAAEKVDAVAIGSLPGANQPRAVLKLDVVEVVKEGDKVLAIISLPPTQFPGEAMFVAVALDGAMPRYFTYERNTGIASLGDPPDTAYFAEYKPDLKRVSFGVEAGVDAMAFTRAVSTVLGMNGAVMA